MGIMRKDIMIMVNIKMKDITTTALARKDIMIMLDIKVKDITKMVGTKIMDNKLKCMHLYITALFKMFAAQK